MNCVLYDFLSRKYQATYETMPSLSLVISALGSIIRASTTCTSGDAANVAFTPVVVDETALDVFAMDEHPHPELESEVFRNESWEEKGKELLVLDELYQIPSFVKVHKDLLYGSWAKHHIEVAYATVSIIAGEYRSSQSSTYDIHAEISKRVCPNLATVSSYAHVIADVAHKLGCGRRPSSPIADLNILNEEMMDAISSSLLVLHRVLISLTLPGL